MRLLLRSRWVWPTGILLVLLGGTVLAAHVLNGPAHRYMEREINRRLTGYSVSVRALHIHPWTVSLELLDSTISQNANPVPPVARIHSLTATINWRALLHRKVVADVIFDRPSMYVNLKNLSAEATSDVALKDRGWQEALEAVTLDLKIDRLEVREGDLTYLDGGPFKPLQVSRVNATAENIRNIRSKERVYPSDIHVEGLVFDAGRLWLDGHADFLAEPHATVKAALRLDEIELDYFRPITSRYNVSVTKGTLSLAGNVEYTPTLTSLVLDQMVVQGARAEYIHTARTAQTEQARARQTVQVAKQVANEPSLELRINRLEVKRSALAIVNRAASPEYRVDLSNMDLTVDNLSNQHLQGTSVARLKGRFMDSGEAQATMTLRPRTGGADMELSARIENADMARMNDLVHNYGGVNVAAGEFSVFTELKVTNGAITGYVKPLFRDVKLGTPPGEPETRKTLGQRMYQGALGIAAKILRNRPRGEVATVVTISGRTDQPVYSMWAVVGHLLENAFIKAILPGFDPERKQKLGQSSESQGRRVENYPDIPGRERS
jgi:Domain of Unknown Function (DUF748)